MSEPHIINAVSITRWSNNPVVTIVMDKAKELIKDKGWWKDYEKTHFIFNPWVEIEGEELKLNFWVCAKDDFTSTSFRASETISVSELGAIV